MLRIKELNLTCMINDSERITEKLGHSLLTRQLTSKVINGQYFHMQNNLSMKNLPINNFT